MLVGVYYSTSDASVWWLVWCGQWSLECFLAPSDEECFEFRAWFDVCFYAAACFTCFAAAHDVEVEARSVLGAVKVGDFSGYFE